MHWSRWHTACRDHGREALFQAKLHCGEGEYAGRAGSKKGREVSPHYIVVKAPEAGIDFKVALVEKDWQPIKFTPTKVGKYGFLEVVP